MLVINKLNLELKSALFLSAIGFILSLITGVIMGAGVTVAIMRAVLFFALFGVLGFGMILVLKKFVPEIYEVISGLFSSEKEESQEDANTSEGSFDETVSDSEDGETDSSGDELSEDGLDDGLSTGGGPEKSSDHLDSVPGSGNQKMGKHVLEEKGIKYEPKLMAEAIRTMMGKDKEE